ncbi:MAG: hypothetical protein M3Y85_10865 [Bacteroidota bacterium]|nr:hypothetical protein [Bacteroidota bacterium]
MKQENNYKSLRSPLTIRASLLVWLLSAILASITACKKEIQSETIVGDETALSKALSKAAKSPAFIVQPGSSIQAAVNTASPGSVIKIKSGTYTESISIN